MVDWKNNEDAGDLTATHAADMSEFIANEITDLCDVCEVLINEGAVFCDLCADDIADVDYREDFHSDG